MGPVKMGPIAPSQKKKKCCSCFENYQPSEMKCFRKTLTCNFVLDVSICSKVKRSYLDRAPIDRPNQGYHQIIRRKDPFALGPSSVLSSSHHVFISSLPKYALIYLSCAFTFLSKNLLVV